jgi:hypothetical protein
MGHNHSSNIITLTMEQVAELRYLLQVQITTLKSEGHSDGDIQIRIHSFYGFYTHHKPTIRIQHPDSILTKSSPSKKSSSFIDFDPSTEVARDIQALNERFY